MKVLLVNGSPHREGCTYTALCQVSAALNEEGIDTDLFWIGDKPISACAGCGKCRDTRKCVFSDGVNDFLDIAGDYDGFVFGAPARQGRAEGGMASFMGRGFYVDLHSGGQRFLLKPAASVVSVGSGGSAGAWDQMNPYFALMQMPIISSLDWNAVRGSGPEEVKKELEGERMMQVLGRNMAYFLQCKDMATRMGLPRPGQEAV